MPAPRRRPGGAPAPRTWRFWLAAGVLAAGLGLVLLGAAGVALDLVRLDGGAP